MVATNCAIAHASNKSDTIDIHHTITTVQISWIEKSFSVAIQTMGLIFILSSAAMFVKFRKLQKLQNIFQMSVLVSNLVLLVIDWPFLQLGLGGCETYSVILLVFGSASTFSTTSIAMERYRKMAKLMNDWRISSKQYAVCVLAVWTTSVLSVTTLLQAKLHSDHNWSSDPSHTATPSTIPRHSNNLCFFSRGALYRNCWHSLTFLALSVIMPACIMTICYTKIYHNLRMARINRWLNQVAAHCSQTSTVISINRRKANIIELNSGKTESFPSQPDQTKERSIMFQGVFSVALVLICWLPITISWIVISFVGYNTEYNHLVLYTILLAKCSTVLNVCHYCCFNVKFRKAYLKLLFDCCQKSTSTHTITEYTNHRNSVSGSKDMPTINPGKEFNVLPTISEAESKHNCFHNNNKVYPMRTV